MAAQSLATRHSRDLPAAEYLAVRNLTLSPRFVANASPIEVKMQNLFRAALASLILISFFTPLAYSFDLAAHDVSIDQNRSPVRVIEVDYSKIKGPHNQFFREVVGAGRAAEGLRADWQRDLALVHRECGFKYIRFHGLLQDELGVYSEDRLGRPRYNFQYIDALN